MAQHVCEYSVQPVFGNRRGDMRLACECGRVLFTQNDEKAVYDLLTLEEPTC